jgi:3-methyladenine DNA glycosylase AlkD
MVSRKSPLQTAETSGIRALQRELKAAGNAEHAEALAWFFKTGKGQYGEGDRFLGIKVPALRKIAHRYLHLSLRNLDRMLASPVHEFRFVALEILVGQYERAQDAGKDAIFAFYLSQTSRINNWDLVDTSAPYLVGEHLVNRSRNLLRELARSESIWERRIAIVSTFAFIRRGQTRETFRIAELLLRDKHDLIHKALGWALRETGKVSSEGLKQFLREHYAAMPRTTLRYAIERFPPVERKQILAGLFDAGR